MNAIKIEKNIPIPDKNNNRTGLATAMRSMEIGDSFTIPTKQSNGVRKAAKLVGIKITTRKESETEHRIWRVA